MTVFGDNMPTIGIVKNPIHHDMTKHVGIDKHFIKKKIGASPIDLKYVSSGCQIAYVLTKALPRIKFEDKGL